MSFMEYHAIILLDINIINNTLNVEQHKCYIDRLQQGKGDPVYTKCSSWDAASPYV